MSENDGKDVTPPIYAVDLLGFGHSEKPGLSYTQYLWESQLVDFALEVMEATPMIMVRSLFNLHLFEAIFCMHTHNIFDLTIRLGTASEVVSLQGRQRRSVAKLFAAWFYATLQESWKILIPMAGIYQRM